MQKKSFNTDREIQNLKTHSSQYYASDRMIKNLYLVVREAKKEKSGISKTFFFRYMFEGNYHQISLGKYPSLSLTSARSKANEYNAMLDNPQYKREGKHPKSILEQKNQRQKTFFEVSQEWINTQEQTPSFERTKTNRIKNHLYPSLKDKPLDSLTRKDFIDCIQNLQDK